MRTTEDRRKHELRLAGKWLCYILLLVLCYVLQTMPGAFALGGIKPVWLVAAALVVSCRENEMASAFYGAVCGLLWDLSAGRLAGFFGIGLLLFCLLSSYLFQMMLRCTVFNVAAVTFVSVAVMLGADYLFNYALFLTSGRTAVLWGTYFPTVVYTAFLSTPLFFLAGLIPKVFNDRD